MTFSSGITGRPTLRSLIGGLLVGIFSLGIAHSSLAFTAQFAYSNFSNDSLDALQDLELKALDGPYVFQNKKETEIVKVVENETGYELVVQKLPNDHVTTIECRVDNEEKDRFSFQLISKIKVPKCTHKQPKKLLAISDIEGNFNAFYNLLRSNGVIDEQYNWTFQKGHLVLNGDFMDRGENVIPVLWLIYKLEQEAAAKGGMVHFILGNHEILNLQGQTNYVREKYVKLAQKFSQKPDKKDAYQSLLSENMELVKWLKSKNVMEKIGDNLFVHGGISPQLVSSDMSIKEINTLVRNELNNTIPLDPNQEINRRFLMASLGPLWYRGMVINYRNHYKKATPKQVDAALRHFGVDRIIVGHSIVEEISTDYDGKIVRTDVPQPKDKGCSKEKNAQLAQALLILDNQLFRVNGLGEKVKL